MNTASSIPRPLFRLLLCTFVLSLLGCLAANLHAADPPPPASPSSLATGRYSLEQFGPIVTAAEAEHTFALACRQIEQAGGGLLIIPPDAAANWTPRNTSQQSLRTPPPPAPAKNWSFGAGVTVVDHRRGTPHLLPPQSTGLQIDRSYDLPPGQSAPHWNYNPAVQINNSVLRGSASYREWLEEPVSAGDNRRFYVRTVRGVFPGMFLNSGDHGRVSRLYVRNLGYDVVKRRPYFTADVDIDLPAGALLHNKTHVNALKAETFAHNETQTFDVMVMRHHYSQGDTYLYDAYFNYMGDVHSTAGDENGACYVAYIRGISDIFRGKVAAWNPAENALTYGSASNAHTLASGRPIINLNPAKWMAGGRCYVMHPGGAILGWAGSVRSKDAPWSEQVIGRYFALDEEGEFVPGGQRVRRWWLITGFSEKDGVKRLNIQRHWWGAKNEQSIGAMYDPRHYTVLEAQPRLLQYIIAAGANVYDASRGTDSGTRFSSGARQRILLLTPGAQLHSAVDFAPGDEIEQAIGPDPFKPMAFRTFTFDKIPGVFPSAIFDVANLGSVSRHSVLHIRGGSRNLADYRDPNRPLPQIPWLHAIRFESAMRRGIVFAGDVRDAAIAFDQPNVARGQQQWIRWRGQVPRAMGVDDNGQITIDGSAPLHLADGGIRALGGLSAAAAPAANLRGLKLAVPAGAASYQIQLSRPESDAQYSLIIRCSWMTSHAVTTQDVASFTVEFAKPAPAHTTLDYLLIH